MRRALFAVLLAAPVPGGAMSIYGADDRVEVRDAGARLREASRGVAALVPWELVESEPGWDHAILAGLTLRQEKRLGPKERFAEQPSAAECSSALVAPDVVLTAGHCVKNHPCETTAFVFDYAYDGPRRAAQRIPIASIGFCKRLIALAFEEADPAAGKPGADWALYQLKDSYADRPVLRFAAGTPKPGARLAALGFPSGLPLKVAYGTAGGANPLDAGRTFLTNTDTFGGNSGGPVFELETMEFVGMLVDGQEDYLEPVKVVDVVTALKRLLPRHRRGRPLQYPEDTPGEGVMRLENFAERVREALAAPSFDAPAGR